MVSVEAGGSFEGVGVERKPQDFFYAHSWGLCCFTVPTDALQTTSNVVGNVFIIRICLIFINCHASCHEYRFNVLDIVCSKHVVLQHERKSTSHIPFPLFNLGQQNNDDIILCEEVTIERYCNWPFFHTAVLNLVQITRKCV